MACWLFSVIVFLTWSLEFNILRSELVISSSLQLPTVGTTRTPAQRLQQGSQHWEYYPLTTWGDGHTIPSEFLKMVLDFQRSFP